MEKENLCLVAGCKDIPSCCHDVTLENASGADARLFVESLGAEYVPFGDLSTRGRGVFFTERDFLGDGAPYNIHIDGPCPGLGRRGNCKLQDHKPKPCSFNKRGRSVCTTARERDGLPPVVKKFWE